jgi:enamine deaminase RidA (YjgF/YER057c/UK114 family)/aromatic ring-opening dioxygenase catalytic subunit (LigB family)
MSEPVLGLIVPGLPHPLLAPDANAGWGRVAAAFAAAREALIAAQPDVLLVYSTMWPSILGHQVQADPAPSWVHVDELFHALGSIPYTFRVDADLAHAWCAAGQRRGLAMRPVAYRGFPIDTGSVVALKLLNPDNRFPAVIVSSNVYADRAETIVLAKAARDATAGRRVAVIAVTTLSNRLFTDWIHPADDRIHAAKDDEWNRKLLEFLADGRLEDCAQLSRAIQQQIRVKKVVNFKPLWFLSAMMGNHNRLQGHVLAYEPIWGTGAAVVTLKPGGGGVGDKEFDEEDVEVWRGDRGVLGTSAPPADLAGPPPPPAPPSPAPSGGVVAATAPKPVGAYPHARREGDLLYLSGLGPRDPATNAIPGGPVRDADGRPLPYDIEAQTRAVIENIRRVLEASGARLEDVIDVTSFLIDMDRDFAGYNRVYNELLGPVGPTRTTVAIRALPTPIAVELKVIARVPR